MTDQTSDTPLERAAKEAIRTASLQTQLKDLVRNASTQLLIDGYKYLENEDDAISFEAELFTVDGDRYRLILVRLP